METKILEVLERYRVAALATLRADGWPQTTLVSYVNLGLRLYFYVSRESQKFANVSRDDRVSIAIGPSSADSAHMLALSMAARVSEVKAEAQRGEVWEKFSRRNPQFDRPDPAQGALLRASPVVISVIDYQQGPGHADLVAVGAGDLLTMEKARPDEWGLVSRRT